MTRLGYTDRLGMHLSESEVVSSRRRVQYGLLGLAVVFTAAAAIALSINAVDESISTVATTVPVEEAAVSPTTTVPVDEAAVSPTTAAGEAVVEGPLGAAPQACVPEAVAERIRLGTSVAIEYQSSDSPADLASSRVVIRGQLLLIDASSGVPLLHVKLRDAVGFDANRLEPGTPFELDFPVGPLGGGLLVGDFVAFVEFVEFDEIDGGRWFVAPEGLWVGCGDDGDAVSVMDTSQAPGWQAIIDRGMSLDDLWEAALFDGDGLRRQPLKRPLVTGDGAAVFDVRLTGGGGGRFRVSLPESIGAGLDTLIELNGRGPVVLEGPAATVTISFEFCEGEDAMVPNRLGSAVSFDPGLVRFCRPDELLSTTVEVDANFEEELDLFDVRPIALGRTYGPVLTGFWTDLNSCSNCARWGPMVYGDEGVVINRTGSTRVTAVSLDDLAEVWTVDTGGFDTYLVGGPDAVYLDVVGGSFQRRNAATGELEWEIDRDEDEGSVVLRPLGETTWLLSSSFRSDRSSRAPVLRAIDIDSGELRWTAEGRAWAKWQATTPVVFGEVVVLMDVTELAQVDVDPVGGSLRAYDIDTGRLAWVTDLQSPTEGYRSRLMFVAEFENGRALMVKTIDGDVLRVDPTNGEVMWRTAVGTAQIDGTVFDSDGRLALSLSGAGETIALDPLTGEFVVPAG